MVAHDFHPRSKGRLPLDVPRMCAAFKAASLFEVMCSTDNIYEVHTLSLELLCLKRINLDYVGFCSLGELSWYTSKDLTLLSDLWPGSVPWEWGKITGSSVRVGSKSATLWVVSFRKRVLGNTKKRKGRYSNDNFILLSVLKFFAVLSDYLFREFYYTRNKGYC